MQMRQPLTNKRNFLTFSWPIDTLSALRPCYAVWITRIGLIGPIKMAVPNHKLQWLLPPHRAKKTILLKPYLYLLSSIICVAEYILSPSGLFDLTRTFLVLSTVSALASMALHLSQSLGWELALNLPFSLHN